MKRQATVYILPLAILFATSCGPKQKDKSSISSLNEDSFAQVGPNIAAQIDTVLIDSVLLQKLEAAFINKERLTSYEDSVQATDSDDNSYSIVSAKLNFNTDAFDDYAIVVYDFRFAYGYIVDGKTGATIETSPKGTMVGVGYMFWTRPLDDGIEYKVIDVNCGDEQEELQIVHHTAHEGTASYLQIYRYDQDSTQGKLIFKRTIMERLGSFMDTSWHRDSTNYIDILSTTSTCIDEINVQEGTEPRGSDSWPRDYSDIIPKKNSTISIYVFNAAKNKFEIKTP